MKYLAFLRGINVGGNHKVPMADLKKTLESMKFENVKTLLSSGNACFEGPKMDLSKLKAKLEKELAAKFGFGIPVILRSQEELVAMTKIDPFKGIKVTPDIRLYVTFLAEIPSKDLRETYESPKKDFRILQVTDGEIFSVLDVSGGGRTVDSMNVIEKKFGKSVTTRNWNTVKKMMII